jgi:Zinc finger, C3HC4 type (RING finger)
MSMGDPNPNICGICFDEYSSVQGVAAYPNDRRPSSSCRHAICLKCAIQHVIASDHAFCPFCRQVDAFSADFATAFEFSPELAIILRDAQLAREAARRASAHRMDRMFDALAMTLVRRASTDDDIPVLQVTADLEVALLGYSLRDGTMTTTLSFRISRTRELLRTEITLSGEDDEEVLA